MIKIAKRIAQCKVVRDRQIHMLVRVIKINKLRTGLHAILNI
jgi:hypothetical protein